VTLVLAIIGTVLGVLNLLWNVWTWRGSGSRIKVETSFRVFPGLARNQLMNLLAQSQLPAEFATAAQHHCALRQPHYLFHPHRHILHLYTHTTIRS
jgi:hypothetical protein